MFSARADAVAANKGEVAATVDGAAARIAVRSKYLQAVLRVLDSGQLARETTSPYSQGVMRLEGADNYVQVWIAVFVQRKSAPASTAGEAIRPHTAEGHSGLRVRVDLGEHARAGHGTADRLAADAVLAGQRAGSHRHACARGWWGPPCRSGAADARAARRARRRGSPTVTCGIVPRRTHDLHRGPTGKRGYGTRRPTSGLQGPRNSDHTTCNCTNIGISTCT